MEPIERKEKISKAEFIARLLPNTYEEVKYLQLDLDVTDLGIADILRNVNKSFPKNSKDRNRIASSEKAITILCKSELLEPVAGILLIICGENSDEINIFSSNYMVLTISESFISSDRGIAIIIEKITDYLVSNFKEEIADFATLYSKFIYDPSDEDEDDE